MMRHLTFCLLFAAFGIFGASLFETDNLYQAEDAYLKAEASNDFQEKNTLYNKALGEYLKLSEKHEKSAIFYNIGNCYFHLGEYGRAALYYAKAFRLSPRDREIVDNFLEARRKSGHVGPSSMPQLIYGIPLSKNEWWTLISIFIFLLGLSFHLYLWTGAFVWKKIRRVSLIFLVLFLIPIGYIYLFFPLEGITVSPSTLRKGAGEQYETIGSDIVLPASRVQILSLSESGAWSKIKTEEDKVGYIPSESLRLIENN